MKTSDRHPRSGRAGARRGILPAFLLCLALFGPAQAQAGFEGVGHFAGSAAPVPKEEFSEEVQLGTVGGMAVNYTGAGGVPKGTVYAATDGKLTGDPTRVAMFTPNGGGLKFSLGWEVTIVEGPYKRCGPDLLPTPTACPKRVKGSPGTVDVDVNQATGNVYVSNGTTGAGFDVIVVYTPDGSEVIGRLGEVAPFSDKTAESPEKLHGTRSAGEIAVNEAGEVYVFDLNNFDNFYHRLAKFVPKVPGKFDEYEYAGTGEDIGAGFGATGKNFPGQPVTDKAGNVYVVSKEASIEMYDPESPADPPVCRFDYAKGGIYGMTVDPKSGEVFFFSYKLPKRLFRLGACDEGTGKFSGLNEAGTEPGEAIEVKPERDDLWGLAFDPVRQLAGRPAGVLYGGAPGPIPNSGVGPGEPGQSSLGYIFAPAKEIPPVVESESVSGVTATNARLHAVIDPKGSQTDYAFQYLTEAAYIDAGESFTGAAESPIGGATLEGIGAPESVGVTLTGLAPDTPYRFRVVAVSHCSVADPGKACEDEGAAQAFRTFPVGPPGPPDGRAYELVSPAEKHGGQVLPADPRISSCGSEAECKPGGLYEHFPMQSAPGGDAIAYEGTAFGPGEGAAIENAYVSRRGAGGWQTVNPTPSLLQKEGGQGYRAFDTELTQAVLGQSHPALSPEAPPEYDNLYSQPMASPLDLSALVSAEPPNRPPSGDGSFGLTYAGASADLTRVFFAANDVLSEEVPGIAPAPENGGAAKSNLYEWERASGQLRLVNVFPDNASTEAGASFPAGSAHPISADGSRAFWEDATGQLFVREDAEATTEIPDSGGFLAAAVKDGSKVLLDNGHIYDLETEATADLTDGKGGFLGIAGQSEDLSHLYFVDTAVLSGEQENSEGEKAQAGKFNLYAWEGGATTFVARLLALDNSGANLTHSRAWSPFPSARTAQASPGGRFLAFLSQAPLTGYGNTGPCETDHANGYVQAPCAEAFLYDSVSGELFCASCNPSGAPPQLGFTTLRIIEGPISLPQARYLTDSGRLYFDSQDSLSPFDTNDGVEDVYEFEPTGVGGCEREGGCVALISAGADGFDSNFLAADETGKNVFFTTRGRLVKADKDELIDLYDAREGGGFPPVSEPPPPSPPLQGPPFEPTPASPTVNDPGNVKPTKPCKKGQVKKKGKCVKKHKPKSSKKAKRGGSK